MDDKQHPLFSVLIANYNSGRYLQETINSVLSQSYDNWEIIIVDDGSNDNSSDIYDKCKDNNRVNIFFNDDNKGCGYTKRRLIELAKGTICGFVDADDALIPYAIDIMVQEHLKNPMVSLVYSQYYCCDKDLKVISTSNSQRQIPQNSSFLEIGHGAISHFATFKKNKYIETSGISPYLKIAEDHDLYLKLEEVGKTLYIPQPLYLYRCGTGNNTSLDANLEKSFYWDVVVFTETCIRRNIPIDKYIFPLFQEYKQQVQMKTSNLVKETREYRLGFAILSPFRKLSRLIKKICLHH